MVTTTANEAPLIQVNNLKKYFPVTKGLILMKTIGHVQAVDSINFTIRQGETLGLVGESGCGKTTTSKLLLRLERPTEGEILLDGKDIQSFRGSNCRTTAPRSRPCSRTLGPPQPPDARPRHYRRTLVVNRQVNHQEKDDRVAEVLSKVGLHAQQANNYPHEFSGGQRQRIAVASALASYPR